MGLKTIRLDRHLSQEDLAKLSGLNVRTIQRIESGGTPSIESLKCIASALEIDISTIAQENTMTDNNVNTENLPKVIRKTGINRATFVLSLAAIFILIGGSVLLMNYQHVEIVAKPAQPAQPMQGSKQPQPVEPI